MQIDCGQRKRVNLGKYYCQSNGKESGFRGVGMKWDEPDPPWATTQAKSCHMPAHTKWMNSWNEAGEWAVATWPYVRHNEESRRRQVVHAVAASDSKSIHMPPGLARNHRGGSFGGLGYGQINSSKRCAHCCGRLTTANMTRGCRTIVTLIQRLNGFHRNNGQWPKAELNPFCLLLFTRTNEVNWIVMRLADGRQPATASK